MSESALDKIKHHNYVLPEPKYWGRGVNEKRLYLLHKKPPFGGFELYTREQVVEMLNAAYGR